MTRRSDKKNNLSDPQRCFRTGRRRRHRAVFIYLISNSSPTERENATKTQQKLVIRYHCVKSLATVNDLFHRIDFSLLAVKPLVKVLLLSVFEIFAFVS